ncbi:hypothetical protein [Streptomyces sp. NPDC058424]|uniref:hypothetical protein n=1 Tax=Streptomyces sp. NPDC058424 TaxID=3346491 RepID=UPI0036584DC3
MAAGTRAPDEGGVGRLRRLQERLYDLSARMRIQHRGPEFYDPKGFKTDLNVWSREGTAAAEVAVSTWNKHFDDLWALAKVPPWSRRPPR